MQLISTDTAFVATLPLYTLLYQGKHTTLNMESRQCNQINSQRILPMTNNSTVAGVVYTSNLRHTTQNLKGTA